MVDQLTKPRRRWFQFSLRTLLILVTLAVGLLVGWRMYVEPYRQQREVMKLIEELGGRYETEAGGPRWMRRVLGAENVQDITFVDLADCDELDRYLGQVAVLPRLETLVVGGRKFDDEYLARLKGLDTLRGLILDSTNVSDEGIASLKGALPKVTVYKSQRRSIAAIKALDGIVAAEMEPAPPKLRQLVLGKHFQVVTRVELHGPKVTDADLAHLNGLSKLDSLNLRYCRQVSDAGPAHLKGLPRLQGLDLSYTRVSDAGLAHITRLPNLQGLTLYYTPISDAALVHLRGLPQLQTLHLGFTKIGDAGLAHLKVLTNLRSLDIRRTLVTNAGLKELQKALPYCKVYHTLRP